MENIFFTPLKLRGKPVSNRFVYQPTESNNCNEKGVPTEETMKVYTERAEGRPGILFIESVDVSDDCQARSNRMVLTPENKDKYRDLIDAIRKISPETLILFQLSHAGRLSDPRFRDPLYVYARHPSEKVMTVDEIRKASRDFISAALLVDEIGGDGVDIKQAHGFLAGDFLHPANNREDEYGGSFENRTRFFTGIFKEVRRQCSGEFIVGTRISPYEGIPGGCGTSRSDSVIEDLSEMEGYARQLEKMGVDFINVSGGYAAANLELLLPTSTYPEGVYRHFTWTRLIKKQVSIPVIGSGYSHLAKGQNALSGDDASRKSLLFFAEQNLKSGDVDLIGIGRQAYADPLFVRKVSDGRLGDIRWCTTCSGCGALLGDNKIVGCSQYDQKFSRILNGT